MDEKGQSWQKQFDRNLAISQYKRKFVSLAALSMLLAIIVAGLLAYFNVRTKIPECRAGINSQDSCNFAWLMSIMLTPLIIVSTIAFIGITITLINRACKLKKVKSLDNNMKCLLFFVILAIGGVVVLNMTVLVRIFATAA